MDPVIIEKTDNAAVLKFNYGVTNPLDLGFIQEISEKLGVLEQDNSVSALVLTGNEKFFCIGFNLPVLYELDREGMSEFYTTFNRLSLALYTFPKPTIAAIAGHATAGGCILALCCDYRFIAEGRKLMGLNEIKLGIPVPCPADCILHQIAGSRVARDIMESGDFYPSGDLLKMGVVDRVLPPEKVLPEALAKAKELGGMPPMAFRMIKHNRVGKVEERIKADLAEKEGYFLDHWFTDEVRGRLKEAMKKF